jgi:hypothetical protein
LKLETSNVAQLGVIHNVALGVFNHVKLTSVYKLAFAGEYTQNSASISPRNRVKFVSSQKVKFNAAVPQAVVKPNVQTLTFMYNGLVRFKLTPANVKLSVLFA